MKAVTKEEPILAKYESKLVTSRQHFKDRINPVITEKDPKTLLLFWIYFTSQGVAMTEPVESWILRAGEKCIQLGYVDLGEQLCKHAIHEANHHLMMIQDTQNLVQHWNKLYSPELQADTFLNASVTQGVLLYQALHEQCILSEKPFCQIAIEYEIENLSANEGAQILKHSFDILGKDIKDCLSFLDEHVKIDVAHTQFNRKVISNFLEKHPVFLEPLIQTGENALKTYGDFVMDCYQQASHLVVSWV